jgi:hypothetical protein
MLARIVCRPRSHGLRRLCSDSLSELGEEASAFRHRSMFPQRERILWSLAHELHQHQLTHGDTMVSLAELRALCYRGTKLADEDVELMLTAATPTQDGRVDLSQFVSRVASRIGVEPPSSSS